MILVTVGGLPFTRLVRKMDEIAAQIEEDVVMQIASDTYQPRHARHFSYRTYHEMQDLCREARVVVCHGGAGSIIAALQGGAAVVAVPRSKGYGEAVDDHQREIVKLLAEEGRIIAVKDMDELFASIRLGERKPPPQALDGGLAAFLRRYVDTLNRRKVGERA